MMGEFGSGCGDSMVVCMVCANRMRGISEIMGCGWRLGIGFLKCHRLGKGGDLEVLRVLICFRLVCGWLVLGEWFGSEVMMSMKSWERVMRIWRRGSKVR